MPNPLIQRDLKHNWHPCAQMKDYETFKPLIVTQAKGSLITLDNGQTLIDAISSWWCKSLGHNHPRLKTALKEQLERFEQVIFAHTTNDVIVQLAEKLSQLTQHLNKIFYASEGSSAIEIALKMALHAQQLRNQPQRTRFIALKNAYHGETTGALSVSDLGLYRDPYRALLFDVHFIASIPYVSGKEDPLWLNSELAWPITEKSLEPFIETAAALIVEPVLQGASGMRVYSADFLKRLHQWAKKHDIYLIADEIMTGLGRTGTMLACEHASIEPDILCLGKGLTSGFLPFSVVLTHNEIYDLFYDDYKTGKAFLHSHTYCGNPLGASVALETLKIIEEEKILNQVTFLEKTLQQSLQEVAHSTNKLKNLRGLGAVVAADIVTTDNNNRRLGFELAQKAAKAGALLRPLGNTFYWLPPLNTDEETIHRLKKITEDVLLSL